MASSNDTSYGNPSIFGKLGVIGSALFHLPAVLIWSVLSKPFHRTNKHKTLARTLGDKAFYHAVKRFNAKQLQWGAGTTLDVYKSHMKSHNEPPVIDELGENARLLWIGKRNTKRVILYFHGGAYLVSMPSFFPEFYRYILDELNAKGKEAGVAILQYSLVPTARFPTQLKQAVLAVQYLLSIGVEPCNIQIAGDSAGGNLILQLLSHILHPIPDLPILNLPTPFRSVYLMSPWVSLTSKSGSMLTNGDSDVLDVECLSYWGQLVLDGVPETYRPYTEPYYAPADWFDKLPSVVEHVLITAGDAECLRDVIVVVADTIHKRHFSAKFLLQQYGVHDDPYFDFLTIGKKKGELTPAILEFFETNFD